MESHDNHYPPEHSFQETGSAGGEENTLAVPTATAILKRMRLGHPSLLPEMNKMQLLAALENSEWQVRVAVVQKLEEYGERAPIEGFIKALKDEDESVRRAAHFLQESYPDRFAETATNPTSAISGKSTADMFDAHMQTFPQTARNGGQDDSKQERRVAAGGDLAGEESKPMARSIPVVRAETVTWSVDRL